MNTPVKNYKLKQTLFSVKNTPTPKNTPILFISSPHLHKSFNNSVYKFTLL